VVRLPSGGAAGCDAVKARQFTGRPSPARDNVFVERLWRSVKYEEVYLRA
jgi:hypothetical protein